MLVVAVLAVTVWEQMCLKRSYPSSVMENEDVRDYIGTEINGDLDYRVTAKVTGGKLVKNTGMPQYQDGLLTYYYVDYIYDTTLTDDYGGSVFGQVTVNCSFSVKPFESRPKDIIVNSLSYSDFSDSDGQTEPAGAGQSALPDDLPLDFLLTSGAGGWSTWLTLNRDGTFEGGYSDTDMGDALPTIYTSEFSGAFSDIRRVNDYTYIMTLNELDLEKTPGEEWYRDGAHIITSEPVGVELGETYLLYTPEAPTDVLPPFALIYWGDSIAGRYVLREKTAENGFVSDELNSVAINEDSEDAEDRPDLYLETDYYTVDVPDDWGELSNCYVRNNPESLDSCWHSEFFYEKGSQDDGYGGFLFSIELWRDESYQHGENYELLGTLAENVPQVEGRPATYFVGYIVVTYPTDVQYSEAHAETYMRMYHEIDGILASFAARDGYIFSAA